MSILNNVRDRSHAVALATALVANPPIEANYLIKVRNLVAQILAQLSRIAEKDRTQIDDIKTKYRDATKEYVRLQRELGNNGLHCTVVALAASFLQFVSPHQTDREIINLFAKEGSRTLGEMFGHVIQSKMRIADSVTSLAINEYAAKSQRGNDANNRQEVIDLLTKVLESLKRAAQTS